MIFCANILYALKIWCSILHLAFASVLQILWVTKKSYSYCRVSFYQVRSEHPQRCVNHIPYVPEYKTTPFTIFNSEENIYTHYVYLYVS